MSTTTTTKTATSQMTPILRTTRVSLMYSSVPSAWTSTPFSRRPVFSKYRHFNGYGTDLSWVTPRNAYIVYFGETWLWILISPSLGYNRFELWFWFALTTRYLAKHGQALTNSVCHVYGVIPYAYLSPFEACQATNCWWVALLNGGEGWHNNHHAYPLSTRHGFLWWEVDAVWYSLYALGMLGQVWDVKVASKDIVNFPRFSGKKTPRPRYDVVFSTKPRKTA